jgi:exodeoxyribonuclease-3
MKLATWNVNSIRARLERLLAWLEKHQPDVLCLQELKATDEDFPGEAIAEAGYRAAVHGQKTYNGVAILSKTEPANVERGIKDRVKDPQARLISADVGGMRVMSAYVPNGAEVGSDKYAYKLDWMRRLRKHLDGHYSPSDRLVLCGDFNVAVDDKDVARPEEWQNTVLCHSDVRDALEKVRSWGFTDVFRKHHPEGGIYSWWDYRMLAFPRNNGLRLDHIFATEPLAACCSLAEVDRDERKGKKPSDHAPVVAVFDD